MLIDEYGGPLMNFDKYNHFKVHHVMSPKVESSKHLLALDRANQNESRNSELYYAQESKSQLHSLSRKASPQYLSPLAGFVNNQTELTLGPTKDYASVLKLQGSNKNVVYDVANNDK